jgi:hypothetical protein
MAAIDCIEDRRSFTLISSQDENAENNPLFSAGGAFFWGLFYAIIVAADLNFCWRYWYDTEKIC